MTSPAKSASCSSTTIPPTGNSDAIDVLFLPASGAEGMGEYARTLTIAREMSRRLPGFSAHFILAREAAYAATCPFPVTPVDGSVTYNTDVVRRELRRLRPRVVVFDSAGRTAQLRAAAATGARIVFVSSRTTQRRRAARLAWLRLVDEHWCLLPPHSGQGLGRWQRAKASLFARGRRRVVGGIFPAADAQRAASALAAHGMSPGGYVLFCCGGGGWRIDDRPAAEVYLEAAALFCERGGGSAVVVMGPLYSGGQAAHQPAVVLGAVEPEAMADLVASSRVVVASGGSMLTQALASGRASVVAAAGAWDQPARVAALAGAGVLQQVVPTPQSLAEGALSLARSADLRRSLEARAREAGFENGLDEVANALASLLSAD